VNLIYLQPLLSNTRNLSEKTVIKMIDTLYCTHTFVFLILEQAPDELEGS
jgi:hypothetical protein